MVGRYRCPSGTGQYDTSVLGSATDLVNDIQIVADGVAHYVAMTAQREIAHLHDELTAGAHDPIDAPAIGGSKASQDVGAGARRHGREQVGQHLGLCHGLSSYWARSCRYSLGTIVP